MRECVVTHHAAQRARERFGVPPSVATDHVRAAFEASVRLPWRYACDLLGRAHPRRKGRPTFRVHGTMLLVCRGVHVITVWPLGLEQWATVLAWNATGVWEPE